MTEISRWTEAKARERQQTDSNMRSLRKMQKNEASYFQHVTEGQMAS